MILKVPVFFRERVVKSDGLNLDGSSVRIRQYGHRGLRFYNIWNSHKVNGCDNKLKKLTTGCLCALGWASIDVEYSREGKRNFTSDRLTVYAWSLELLTGNHDCMVLLRNMAVAAASS